MIKKIIFSNLFSFDKTQIIDFSSSVPVYAIYGKNSAGKSNFLKLLTIINDFIIGQINLNSVIQNKSNTNEDNKISIEVLFENVNTNIEYGYGVEIDTQSNEIIEEKLKNITTNKVYLHYKNEKLKSEVLDEKTIDILNRYNIAAQGMIKYLKELKENEVLKEINAIQDIFNIGEGFEYNLLQEDEQLKELVLQEVKKIDVAIEDFEVVDLRDLKEEWLKSAKTEEEKQYIKHRPSFEIKTVHKKFKLPLDLESEGTKRYFNFIYETLLIESKYGFSILRIDELELHFHDELFKKFIEFFKQSSKNQLIFTTHNQLILEEKLLPKSSIIFIEKKEDSSEIYTLEDFEGVKDDSQHNWKKMYNIDRFGAFPHVR